MPLIRLEGIGKVFKGDADEETWALKDITLDINRGEYMSVSGPSGCGKSTFLSSRAAGYAVVRPLLLERQTDRSFDAVREDARAQSRHRPRLSELQSHWRHDGLRKHRVSAHAARRAGSRTANRASPERWTAWG